MALKIIKRGSLKTADIQPFFFTEDNTSGVVKTPVWPEASPENEFPSASEQEMKTSSATEPSPESSIDIEQLEKEAFDRGYAEGQKELEAVARQRIDETMACYANTFAEISGLKNTLRAQVEEEVVRLAVAVAKKIVCREISLDATIIHTLVRVALERVSGKSRIVVHLSPTDYEYMRAKREELEQLHGQEITFTPDHTITQGGCLIQTETGDIDARIEEEFHEVENVFFKGLR